MFIKYIKRFDLVITESEMESDWGKVMDDPTHIVRFDKYEVSALAMRAKYKGSDVSFGTMGSAQFPLTSDIVNIIEQGKDLDFVIVSQYGEGIDYIPKSVWIFEPNRMKESIDIQRIKVYDSVYYLKDKINIKLQRQDKS